MLAFSECVRKSVFMYLTLSSASPWASCVALMLTSVVDRFVRCTHKPESSPAPHHHLPCTHPYPQPKQIPWNLEEKADTREQLQNRMPLRTGHSTQHGLNKHFCQRAEGWSREQAQYREDWQREGCATPSKSSRCLSVMKWHQSALVEKEKATRSQSTASAMLFEDHGPN